MIRVILSAAALLLLAAPGGAQEADGGSIAAQKAAMQRFAWMLGTWRGPGKGLTRTGPYQVTQTERIGPMLDGTLIVLEGKGYAPDGSVAFNAFGIVSYDPATKAYTLHSYAQGYAGDFPFEPTDTGYVWQIPAGPGAVIRYTATLAGGTWTEVGDYIAGGQPPRRMFEMNLRRTGDTAWPSAGGPPKD